MILLWAVASGQLVHESIPLMRHVCYTVFRQGKEGRRAGRCEGFSDLEWRLWVDIMPPEPPTRGRGLPQTPVRKVVNTLLSGFITGCRWCATPRGPRWASKSAAPRGLPRWQADSTLAARQARVLGLAQERGLMHWEYGAVDGALSPGERRG